MRIALTELGLERLRVIYPGERTYPLTEQIMAVPLTSLTHSDFRLSF